MPLIDVIAAALVGLGMLGTLGPGARAEGPDPSLYAATTVVTGSSEESRAEGMAAALETVLVKLSGNPNLVGDERIVAEAATAEAMVTAVSFRDLYAGRQIHDEQGTYDRPHAMTVAFDPEGVGRVLARLGEHAHAGPRPPVTLVLQVDAMREQFVLSADATAGRAADMRASLALAAERVGLVLRHVGDEAALALRPDDIRRIALTGAARAPEAGAERLTLFGNLAWDAGPGLWNCHWALTGAGQATAWSVEGVNFDEAFRVGLRGTLGIVAGKPLRPPPG